MLSREDGARAGWVRRLPNHKPISALGFGCSSVWAKPSFPEPKAQALLAAAVDAGINHFDTSPSYGAGHAERRLGIFLRDHDPNAFTLSTKVGSNLIGGRVLRGFDIDLLRRSFDASLERLGVERVDILYLHGPELSDLNDSVFQFFETLKTEKRISWSGVNSFDASVMNETARTPIDVAMLQYNVADQRAARQIDKLADAGKTIMSATAVARGKFSLSTLVPRDRPSLWYLFRALRHDPLSIVDGHRLRRRLSRIPKPPAEVAIQFVTGHPRILSGLFGTSRVAHLIANARAGHGALSDEAWRSLVRSDPRP